MRETPEEYLRRRAVISRPWFPVQDSALSRSSAGASGIPAAAVIPCHNEYPGVSAVLDSLAASAEYASGAGRLYVICVVNGRESDSRVVQENNLQLLRLLQERAEQSTAAAQKLQVITIDCASPGRRLSGGDGVGLARKIGMDYALCLFNDTGVISCLDADTLVARDYFSALIRFGRAGLDSGAAQGAVLSFTHRQEGEGPEAETAAKIAAEYESRLLEHSRRLKSAGSPYYPVALGSAIACTVRAYIAAGGMNRRLAGEDFYFLQALIKTGSVVTLTAADGGAAEGGAQHSALVFPSSRISGRVPFGTGPKIGAVLRGTEIIQPFREESYRILREWLALVQSSADSGRGSLLDGAERISGELRRFLEDEGFPSVWENLCRNNKKSSDRLVHAFHCWFDGLKTIRLFHYLERPFTR